MDFLGRCKNLATKEKILEVVDKMKREYSGYTIVKGEDNYNSLKEILKFTSCALITSSLKKLNELFQQSASWNNRT